MLVPGAVGLLALLVLVLMGLAAARAKVSARDRSFGLTPDAPSRLGIGVAVAIAVVLVAVLALPDGSHPRTRHRLAFSSAAATTVGSDLPADTVTDNALLDLPTPTESTTTTTVVSPPVTDQLAPAATAATTVTAAARKRTTVKAAVVRAPTTTTTAPPPPPAPAHDGHGSRMRRALDQWVNSQNQAASVSVGVSMAGGDSPVWTAEAMRKGTEAPVRAADLYGSLSITKSFTEALVLREVAAGAIDLDAPMSALPGVDPVPDGVTITPRMLLQHTSGLVDYLRADGYDATQPITPADTVNLALHTPLMFDPGTKASYSRTNFHWLGLLLEQVTGHSFGELVAGLAREFGLTHTSLDPTARPGWVGYASGGVQSTVGDLAQWGADLFTPGRVLQPDQLSLLTTIGDVGASLGMWPLCPCHAGPDGATVHEAIGQVVAHGGILYFPSDHMVMVVHVDPPTSESADQSAAVASVIRSSFAGP